MTTLGLDIGGANIKVAHSNGSAFSVPFALWKAPELLTDKLASVLKQMPAFDRLGVTMTGELCDCFPTKRAGVRHIVDAVEFAAPGETIGIWTLQQRFRSIPEIRDDPMQAAAANWLALAAWLSQTLTENSALLLDIGSTTTDIIYLEKGRPLPRGWTDFQRMNTGELVYTGLRRTPICAVLGVEVAAEFFATMLDAYVLLGIVPEDETELDTADGRPCTRSACHARIARMRCADPDEMPLESALELARRAIDAQQDKIAEAVNLVVRDRPIVTEIILSGSGEAIARRWRSTNTRLGKCLVRSLSDELGRDRSQAACAVAIAEMMKQSDAEKS